VVKVVLPLITSQPPWPEATPIYPSQTFQTLTQGPELQRSVRYAVVLFGLSGNDSTLFLR